MNTNGSAGETHAELEASEGFNPLERKRDGGHDDGTYPVAQGCHTVIRRILSALAVLLFVAQMVGWLIVAGD